MELRFHLCHLFSRGVREGDIEGPLSVLRRHLLRSPDERPQIFGQHPLVPDHLRNIHTIGTLRVSTTYAAHLHPDPVAL